MKKLNDFEKEVVRTILKYNENNMYNCLYNIVFDFGILNYESFWIHPKKNQTVLYILNHDFSNSFLRQNQVEIVGKLYTITNLIESLIKENYIFFIKTKEVQIDKRDTTDFTPFEILDPKLQKILFDYDNGYFIPSEDLRAFEKNDFKTPDEINALALQIQTEERLEKRQISERKYNEEKQEEIKKQAIKDRENLEKQLDEQQKRFMEYFNNQLQETENRSQRFQLEFTNQLKDEQKRIENLFNSRDDEKDKKARRISITAIIVPAISALISILVSIFVPVSIKNYKQTVLSITSQEIKQQLDENKKIIDEQNVIIKKQQNCIDDLNTIIENIKVEIEKAEKP